MALASKYQLCLYSGTITALSPIKTVLAATGADPFPASFQSFSEVVGTDLNGAPIRAGFARVTWHWDYLFRSDYDDLAAFIGNVFIETRKVEDAWAQYQAVMAILKEPEPMEGLRCGPVDVSFSMLILQ